MATRDVSLALSKMLGVFTHARARSLSHSLTHLKLARVSQPLIVGVDVVLV